MRNESNQRRKFVKNSAAGLALLSLPDLLAARQKKSAEKKKIVCVGGHPDDPESGCGGTLAKFAKAGFDVTIIYLTTGDAGIEGKSLKEAAAIRKQEAINACKILNAKPVFAGQIDGDTVVDNAWVKKIGALLEIEKPAVVFTHWPLDSHKDHQVASLLTIQAWMRTGKQYPLYFFEVSYGIQTVGFNPTDYMDITDTQEQKRKALFCHTSQFPETIYAEGHTAMEDFRGREIGAKAGEAFVRLGAKNGMPTAQL